jgi:23S rRNA (guanine1835-N2)-methyltransferase
LSHFDQLNLRQYPPVNAGQAFNSADSLLVDAAAAHLTPGHATLVVNDEFGAVCCALQAATLWTDSYLASLSLQNNLRRNSLASVNVLWSTLTLPQQLIPDRYKLVVMRVPKQLSYFKYQLSQLSQLLPEGTRVLVAGMDKHLSPATASLIEHYIGPTKRHRGQYKARLFSACKDERCLEPFSGSGEYYSDNLNQPLTSLANVFAREKMDIGSRFLLDSLETLAPTERLIDLACGNGIIGLTAASQGLCKSLLMCDESAMAIASARINAECCALPCDLSYHHGDGLLDYEGELANLILCNPPFHLNHRVDEGVGRRLLTQCAAHLVKGGSLCLVANRHLNYLPALKRDFSVVEKLAQNNKFVVWQARR